MAFWVDVWRAKIFGAVLCLVLAEPKILHFATVPVALVEVPLLLGWGPSHPPVGQTQLTGSSSKQPVSTPQAKCSPTACTWAEGEGSVTYPHTPKWPRLAKPRAGWET